MTENEIAKLEREGLLELGQLLGGRRAFSAIAGRCSAADAECIKRIRDQKQFRHVAPSWEEFCPKHLGMSRTTANVIIRQLEDYGPEYFELVQLTRVTPAEYRNIAGAVKDHAIRWNDEVIALIPENSEKVAAAVADLKNNSGDDKPAARESKRKNPLRELVETGEDLIAQFVAITITESEVNPMKSALPKIRENIIRKLRELDLAA